MANLASLLADWHDEDENYYSEDYEDMTYLFDYSSDEDF